MRLVGGIIDLRVGTSEKAVLLSHYCSHTGRVSLDRAE